MKFIHAADMHIGGWRDPRMSQLTIEAFQKLVQDAIGINVDFVLIAGDLFNTSLPAIDFIKEVTKQLQVLKGQGIKVYIIPGSHDYSPSGKTMLSVLEEAKLVYDVAKVVNKVDEDSKKIQLKTTVDEKTQTTITGLFGKKNMLEKNYYQNIDYSNLKSTKTAEELLRAENINKNYRIFMFHTALDELKPRELSMMESSPVSLLPEGFDYYAGGHVHIVEKNNLAGYKNIVYPGPLFPNSFSELEKLKKGGYYLYDNGNISYKEINLKEVLVFTIDCNDITPEHATDKIKEKIKDLDVSDKIILFRLYGKLKTGKALDINTKIIMSLYDKGAYFVMKNTSGVSSDDFQEVKGDFEKECIEEEIIENHLGQTVVEGMDISYEKSTILKLMESLSSEQDEGETRAVYEERILKDCNKFIE